MASILDRYGIKEVADVTFYEIDDNGDAGKPVLYLDTLKVSTIEQTAETADARGGKGNPKLVTWDYGKDITVTLEDALFSAKSLAIMFGNGTVGNDKKYITKTSVVRLTADKTLPEFFTADVYDADRGSARKKVFFSNPTNMPSDGVLFSSTKLALVSATTADGKERTVSGSTITLTTDDKKGDKIFITYKAPAQVKEVVVSSDSFPGTYYVTGDTYARSDIDGSDQFFQFIIPKAKVTSENTITLEAEGDPSVFNMNLTVLRPEDGEMMKLVQYDLINEDIANAANLTD
jgi:hypothetical protein